ncbi:hypothetical protein L228DRAFT_240351 [Xylona heveae TC161]|uniref:Myb-like domain-containing protein n=1 Tax=Xylona heveae (strain CBS 132557 / TC161) TaxID=1328760 RepID=A0A165AJ85_XYLHT|nr:hypothetical protein L228DRAFT_240351 [Xylona heveae TC161]KZF20570.1 hypothetical protein L228DRAFT_240351 [Xylona heveae TC161]
MKIVNRPKTRKLTRWDSDKDVLTGLWIQHVCQEEGVKIPWHKIVPHIGPNVTVGALLQHQAKLRDQYERKGFHVPPASNRRGKKSRVSGLAAEEDDLSQVATYQLPHLASEQQGLSMTSNKTETAFDDDGEESDETYSESKPKGRKKQTRAGKRKPRSRKAPAVAIKHEEDSVNDDPWDSEVTEEHKTLLTDEDYVSYQNTEQTRAEALNSQYPGPGHFEVEESVSLGASLMEFAASPNSSADEPRRPSKIVVLPIKSGSERFPMGLRHWPSQATTDSQLGENISSNPTESSSASESQPSNEMSQQAFPASNIGANEVNIHDQYDGNHEFTQARMASYNNLSTLPQGLQQISALSGANLMNPNYMQAVSSFDQAAPPVPAMGVGDSSGWQQGSAIQALESYHLQAFPDSQYLGTTGTGNSNNGGGNFEPISAAYGKLLGEKCQIRECIKTSTDKVYLKAGDQASSSYQLAQFEAYMPKHDTSAPLVSPSMAPVSNSGPEQHEYPQTNISDRLARRTRSNRDNSRRQTRFEPYPSNSINVEGTPLVDAEIGIPSNGNAIAAASNLAKFTTSDELENDAEVGRPSATNMQDRLSSDDRVPGPAMERNRETQDPHLGDSVVNSEYLASEQAEEIPPFPYSIPGFQEWVEEQDRIDMFGEANGEMFLDPVPFDSF